MDFMGVAGEFLMQAAPRRLSVADHHPYASRIAVRVNGIEQTHVIAYDCDAGWVERYETMADGSKMGVVSHDARKFMRETVRGDVAAVIR